jgi:hypothetical protein
MDITTDRNGDPISEEEYDLWAAHGIDREDAGTWIEADLTIDQALGWREHGCGAGDAAGCWTQDPEEAFAEPEEDDDSDA